MHVRFLSNSGSLRRRLLGIEFMCLLILPRLSTPGKKSARARRRGQIQVLCLSSFEKIRLIRKHYKIVQSYSFVDYDTTNWTGADENWQEIDRNTMLAQSSTEKTTRKLPLWGAKMVGAIGFEPTAFWSQTRRATKLRHAPTSKVIEYQVQTRLAPHW